MSAKSYKDRVAKAHGLLRSNSNPMTTKLLEKLHMDSRMSTRRTGYCGEESLSAALSSRRSDFDRQRRRKSEIPDSWQEEVRRVQESKRADSSFTGRALLRARPPAAQIRESSDSWSIASPKAEVSPPPMPRPRIAAAGPARGYDIIAMDSEGVSTPPRRVPRFIDTRTPFHILTKEKLPEHLVDISKVPARVESGFREVRKLTPPGNTEYDIINTQYLKNASEREASDLRRTREHLAKRWKETHDFDPIRGQYYDAEKEQRMAAHERTSAAAQRDPIPHKQKLPHGYQVSEGAMFNLINGEILDPVAWSKTEAAAVPEAPFDLRFEQAKKHMQIAKWERERTRRQNSVSNEPLLSAYRRGYNIVTTEHMDMDKAAKMLPHARRPTKLWERAEASLHDKAEGNVSSLRRTALEMVMGEGKSGVDYRKQYVVDPPFQTEANNRRDLTGDFGQGLPGVNRAHREMLDNKEARQRWHSSDARARREERVRNEVEQRRAQVALPNMRSPEERRAIRAKNMQRRNERHREIAEEQALLKRGVARGKDAPAGGHSQDGHRRLARAKTLMNLSGAGYAYADERRGDILTHVKIEQKSNGRYSYLERSKSILGPLGPDTSGFF